MFGLKHLKRMLKVIWLKVVAMREREKECARMREREERRGEAGEEGSGRGGKDLYK